MVARAIGPDTGFHGSTVRPCRPNPGVPNSGIVAVCDFGGSGATVSLVDAANGYQAIVPPCERKTSPVIGSIRRC